MSYRLAVSPNNCLDLFSGTLRAIKASLFAFCVLLIELQLVQLVKSNASKALVVATKKALCLIPRRVR